MALNFLGLGFSFGAKDAGLKNKQRQVASGFENISEEVEKMGARAESGTKPLGRMTDQLSGSAMDKLTESIDTLAMSLGKDLPKASRRGADNLHRATSSIENNERRIGGGFDFIRGSYEKLTSLLSVNRLQAFLQAISLSKLGDIGQGIQNIATTSTNLTTSLEGTIVAAAKTSRQMGANFGLAGKALGRFTGEATSMGIALNIGTEKAGEAVYQITLATKELGAVGIKSAADLAKFAEVSGVSASDVTQIFKKAGQQFGLTGDQLKQLAGAALKSGEQIGDIGGQFKAMPQIMELIARRAAVMGKKFDPKKMADFASQTLALSGAFYQMGESSDDARELATGFASKMVESGEDFAGMFAGTKTDLNEFLTGIGIASGDINVAFKSMSQGPGEFMTGMAEMVMKARKDGRLTEESMNQLRARLTETFGAKQAAAMVNFFGKVDEKQLQAMKTTSKATGDLGKFAKAGFSTGRTLAEEFELMEGRFVMSFRNIGRSSAQDFVKKTGQEFNKFNKQLKKIVDEKGPLAGIVVKMSEIHQIGAMALIPQTLRPMAGLFGTIVKEAAPMIGILGSLGFRLNMLASPFTLIITAAAVLGGWFVSLRMEGKSTGEAIKIMSSKISAGAKKLWSTVKGWVSKLVAFLASVDWGAVFTRIFHALATVMKEAGAILRQIPWKQIFAGILKAVGKIFQFLASKEFGNAVVRVFEFLGNSILSLVDVLGSAVKRMFEAVASMDIGGIATHFVDMFGRIFATVGRYLGGLFEKLLDLFAYTASAGFRDKLMQISEGVAVGVRALINKLFDLFDSAVEHIMSIDLGKAVENILMTAANLAVAFLNVTISALETFVSRIPQFIGNAFDLLLKFLKEIPAAIGRFLSRAAEMIPPLMKRLVVAVLDGIWNILSSIPGLVVKAFQALPAIIAGLGVLLRGAAKLVIFSVLSILDAIRDWLINKIPGAAKAVEVAFVAIKVVLVGLAAYWTVMLAKWLAGLVMMAAKVVWEAGVWVAQNAIKLASTLAFWVAVGAQMAAYFVRVGVMVAAEAAKWVAVNALKLASSAASMAVMLAQHVVMIATMIAGWVAMGIAAVAAWLVALGPIGLIIVAVVAVGVAILALTGKIKAVASAIGGFFKGIASKVGSLFSSSSSSLTQMLDKNQKSATNAQTYFTDGMKKAMAELQKQKEKYQEADKAWQAEKAVLDKKQLEDLKARQFTFKQVEVTSANAAETAKMASDAAAQGIKDNIELVDKQVRIASSLAMPKMDQGYMDAIKQFDEANAAYEKAFKAKDMDQMNQLGDALVGKLKEQIDTLGISGKQLKEIRDEQLKTFSMRLDLQDKMTTSEKKAYQASLDQIFDKSLKAQYEGQKMVRAINEQHGQMHANLMATKQKELAGIGLYDIKRIEIERKYYKLTNDLQLKAAEDHAKNEQMMLAAKNRATEQKLILEKYMGVESNKIYEDIANGVLTVENDKYAALSALQQKFAAETQTILEKVPESMKMAAESAQSALNRSYYNQLKEITTNEQLSIDQRKAALEGLEKWRAEKMTEFSQMVDKQTKDMVASNGAVVKDMEDTFGKFSEGLTQKAEESALKANAAVGSVQKELGVSAQDALTNLKDIAAIDPEKFAADLKIIKAIYIDFAKTAQAQSKEMLVATNKAFEEFNKVAIDHWTNQKGNISMMAFSEDDLKKLGTTIGAQVDRIFSMLTKLIAEKVQAAIGEAFVKAFAKVINDAKEFTKDAMAVFRDLTQQMVKAFGQAWAKILEFTANAINAIEKDVARAVANLKRIEAAMRASSSAQASTAGADVKQDVKMDNTKTDLGNIFQATHHPEWYENDFKYKAMDIINALNALASAIAAAPRGGSIPSNSSRVRAGIKADADVGGPGANRANIRAGGRPS